MKLFKLTDLDGGEILLGQNQLRMENIAEIVRVGGNRTRLVVIRNSDDGKALAMGSERFHYMVRETPSEILAMIGADVAKPPKPPEPRPVAVNPPEYFLDKLRNGHEKAKWDVIPGGIEIHHEADIKRIAELEAKMKAWQDAASVDLAESKDEPTIPCKTPEELIERLRHLYRWASTAEKRAAEAEAELAALKYQTQEVPPLEPWRIAATVVDGFRKSASSIMQSDASSFRKKMAYMVAADAIECANGGRIHREPYKIRCHFEP